MAAQNQEELRQLRDDGWPASKLLVLGIITLAVALTIISLIAETGLHRF